MGIRAQRILEEFPEIPQDHIYMGFRKDNIATDILFDDAMHNILNSKAKYPILMRRPWNQEATGMLAVNNYDEFLKLVEVISSSYSTMKDDNKNPSIVALVGPSGSGKTTLMNLFDTDIIEKDIRKYGKNLAFAADILREVGSFSDEAALAEGADIRVFSFNVLFNTSIKNPTPLERSGCLTNIMKYFEPDVIGLQEMNIHFRNQSRWISRYYLLHDYVLL